MNWIEENRSCGIYWGMWIFLRAIILTIFNLGLWLLRYVLPDGIELICAILPMASVIIYAILFSKKHAKRSALVILLSAIIAVIIYIIYCIWEINYGISQETTLLAIGILLTIIYIIPSLIISLVVFLYSRHGTK